MLHIEPSRRERSAMRRLTLFLALGLTMLATDSARASGLDLRLGMFTPRTESNLFRDDEELYTVRKKDWRGFTGGGEFNFQLSDNVELGIGLDGYSKSIDTVYRDFVDSNDRDIPQTLRLTAAPLSVNLRLVPARRRSSIVPYAAVGADLFFYKYEEFGDFIDFGDPTRPIISDAFESEGAMPGFHVAGGLRIPLNYDVALTVEGKYQWAKDELGDDFRPRPGQDPLELDLSGWSVTAGVNIRF
jgi:hypothetical protein